MILLNTVVKCQGQSGHSPVETLHRFGLPSSLWYYDFSEQSRFQTARRRLERLVLPSIFDMSFIIDDVKLAELFNNSFV